jgi:hypothetical protein
MRNNLLVLAWSACLRASWLAATGSPQGSALNVAKAGQLLEMRATNRRTGHSWRPMLDLREDGEGEGTLQAVRLYDY